MEACGGSKRGRCTKGGVCECLEGWSGPHCLAHRGRDPILWDPPDEIADIGFIPPRVTPSRGLIVMLGLLMVFLILSAKWKQKLKGWTPIPEAEKSVLLNSPSKIRPTR